jgi:hypothetical protein
VASPNDSVRVQRFFQFIDSSPAAVGIDRTRSDTKPSPLSAHLDGQLAFPIPLPSRLPQTCLGCIQPAYPGMTSTTGSVSINTKFGRTRESGRFRRAVTVRSIGLSEVKSSLKRLISSLQNDKNRNDSLAPSSQLFRLRRDKQRSKGLDSGCIRTNDVERPAEDKFLGRWTGGSFAPLLANRWCPHRDGAASQSSSLDGATGTRLGRTLRR